MKQKNLLILTLILTPQACYPFFNVVKPSATLRVKSGASFVVENQLNNFKGNLVKEAGATISGGDIVFKDGTFDDSGSKVKLTGNLNPQTTNKICLTGNQIFKGKRGAILQTLEISGLDNRLEGILQLNNDVTLQDYNTSVTYAVSGRMSRNIAMNGGKVYLEEDLHFVDDMFFTGSGVIMLNKRNLHLGSKEIFSNASLYFDCAQDVELHARLNLSGTWTFSGQSMIEGNGDVLNLCDGGNIVLESGSSLLLRDLTICGVSGNNIRCLDNVATFSFLNLTWIQDANYSFTCGSLQIVGDLDVVGSYTFVYQSNQTSTVREHACLKFGPNTTFSYDPVSTSSRLIAFEDSSSKLILNGAALYVTATNLQLEKGIIEVTKNSSLTGEGEIVFGDNDINKDCSCVIDQGVTLDVKNNAFVYKNVAANGIQFLAGNANLSIYGGASLKLYQDMNFESGTIRLYEGATLARNVTASVGGSVSAMGAVSFEIIARS